MKMVHIIVTVTDEQNEKIERLRWVYSCRSKSEVLSNIIDNTPLIG